jgi:hypothetical protein
VSDGAPPRDYSVPAAGPQARAGAGCAGRADTSVRVRRPPLPNQGPSGSRSWADVPSSPPNYPDPRRDHRFSASSLVCRCRTRLPGGTSPGPAGAAAVADGPRHPPTGRRRRRDPPSHPVGPGPNDARTAVRRQPRPPGPFPTAQARRRGRTGAEAGEPVHFLNIAQLSQQGRSTTRHSTVRPHRAATALSPTAAAMTP